VREGIKIAIIGRPNVGKSSLFNKLLQQDRAIVTDIPGTTRDSLTEQASIGGVPVMLVDTAGIREAQDLVEQLGIERSYAALTDADLAMLVLDASTTLQTEDQKLLIACQTSSTPIVIVINKCDLLITVNQTIMDQTVAQIVDSLPVDFLALATYLPNATIFMVSAKSGAGLEDLQKGLVRKFLGRSIDSRDDILILDARHFALLQAATSELQNAVRAFDEGFSEEVALCHLHIGLRKLGEITGETTIEDILGQIFSTFCIGK
jgi:tRNA modification GTPase